MWSVASHKDCWSFRLRDISIQEIYSNNKHIYIYRYITLAALHVLFLEEVTSKNLLPPPEAETSVPSPVEVEVSTEAVARPMEVPEVPAEPEKVVPEVAESDSTDDAPGKEKDPGFWREGKGAAAAWKRKCWGFLGRDVGNTPVPDNTVDAWWWLHTAPQKIIPKMWNLKTHVLFTRAIFSFQPLFSGEDFVQPFT